MDYKQFVGIVYVTRISTHLQNTSYFRTMQGMTHLIRKHGTKEGFLDKNLLGKIISPVG